ncbi:MULTISPECIES: site-2 protease family protein [Pseudanabaena]|jgi:membrane-associated protease RseP (regulator of RpoE activity)|uniref:site-2 protease family protein n=1 Tax=Pseudanabaena TaxID=1152 RepID=UPI0024784DB3|nr:MULTISPECIES: site-2 protease family protein [Pseudanabaena]MEA5486270.1 site-2 protease family protein [Pseudanabaena sp. CCNP1317]WGS71580.1 site-2 protease family protein [Pseudanabaena galeata CCNP1313]
MMSTPLLPITVFILTLALLGWGYFRSRKFGKLGLLSWLQFVALMSPWLVYFGLFVSGVFINFTTLLFLLLGSTIAYVAISNQLRKAVTEQKSEIEQKLKQDLEAGDRSNAPDNSTNKSPINSPIAVAMSQGRTQLKLFKALPVEDMKLIQGIFGIETYYVTETIPYQEGAIFKGNLRGEPDVVHNRLTQTLSDRLGDKYNLFLVEGQDRKPVVIVLPSRVSTIDNNTIPQRILIAVLIVANGYTALNLGALVAGIPVVQAPQEYLVGLPFALGIGTILGVRELAMRMMAKKYKVTMSLPFLLPSSQLGSFGAFSRISTPLPNRLALFDIAIAPAVVSGLLSLGLLLVGLYLSAIGLGSIDIPSQIFQASVLAGTLAKLFLGDALHTNFVSIHPLVILGWLGSVITALNLMPAGQLDGGRIVQSIYGRRTASWTTVLTLIFLVIATVINPLALYWGGIILILLRDLERPMLNELSELDGDREALGVVALFWMLITLLPLTSGVAERLGIGSGGGLLP